MNRNFLGVALAAIACAPAAWAHHGFGGFDRNLPIELEGTITGVDFVNPHAYLYFDVAEAEGKTKAMRCEMRAATVLRRSGWSPEMFVKGSHVTIDGIGHRSDPASCYIENLKIGDAPALERYQQLTSTGGANRANRAARTASGKPNLAGDWAQEQYLIAAPPSGRGGLVPKSMIPGIESGQIPMSEVPDSGWGARPVTFTPAGQEAAARIRAIPADQNTRARCEITSVLFDWVFDGPINRITQTDATITLEYGRGIVRTVHMNMASHPASIERSRAGHSIGRWDGDTLVVDTVGFTAGILAGNVAHGEQLHIVERFTLNPETLALRREYTAEDPQHFTNQYAGADIVMPADAPFAVDTCKELTYVNYAEQAGE